MSERYGKCKYCKGRGKIEKVTESKIAKTEVLAESDDKTSVTKRVTIEYTLEVRDCGTCGETGISGGISEIMYRWL